jgi:hypothetical protein
MTNLYPPINALSHGAYSEQVVLPWENKQDFDHLHEAFRQEYSPNGLSEEEAVFDLADLHWKKRRVHMGSLLAFRHDGDIEALTEAGRQNGWEGIAEHFAKPLDNNESARDAMRKMNKAMLDMTVLVTEFVRKRIPTNGNMDQERNPGAVTELDKWNLLLKEMGILASTFTPALRFIESFCLDEKVCERAYKPDFLERELKILADIDKRIDKKLVQLVKIKEYKRLYQPQVVESSPAQPTALPVNVLSS